MVSRAMPTPDQRMNTATARPTYPSTVRWAKCSTRQPARTAAEEITSFRLSTEVAWRVVDWMCRPSPAKNRDIHSFPRIATMSTPKTTGEVSTGWGWRIFPHRGLGQVRPDHQDQRGHHPGRRCIHTGHGRRGGRRPPVAGPCGTPAGSPPRRPRPRGCSPRRPQGPPTRKTPRQHLAQAQQGRCTGCPPPPPAFPPPGGRRGESRFWASFTNSRSSSFVMVPSPLTSFLFHAMCPSPPRCRRKKKNPQASCLCLARGSIHCHLGPGGLCTACTCLGDYTTAPHRKARLTSGPRKPPPPAPWARLALPGNFL